MHLIPRLLRQWLSLADLPDGEDNHDANIDHISIYVNILREEDEEEEEEEEGGVLVMYGFQLQDALGRTIKANRMVSSPRIFCRSVSSHGIFNFMQPSDLEASPFLRDSVLVIKCTLCLPHLPASGGREGALQLSPP